MQQRREEIIAKTAKLAELKRQRELRANQANATRQSLGGAADVGYLFVCRKPESAQLTQPASLVQAAYSFESRQPPPDRNDHQ